MSESIRLKVRRLNNTDATNSLIQSWRVAQADGVVLDLSDVERIYPNGVVPLAATLAYFNQVIPGSVKVDLGGRTRLDHVGTPLTRETFDRDAGHNLTDSVWQYNTEEEAQWLAGRFTDRLSEKVACEEGVIDTLNWCLYEVMDNVFQHSSADRGFIMMQLHKRERRCVIAVADTGIGIQKSLILSRAVDIGAVREAGSAINCAVQQGVTSKVRVNQGNGLYGLRRAVEVNGGLLSVRSGRGTWEYSGDVTYGSDRNAPVAEPENHQSTLIDWRLECARKVRIEEALGGHYAAHNEFLEDIEDDNGAHRIPVRDIEEALGSRKLGEDIRTRLENYLAAGALFVVLDFRGVGVVSSSFADEVMAKLAESIGELEFRRRILIDGASITNRSLIDRAISLRLGQG